MNKAGVSFFFQLKKRGSGAYRYGFNGKENDNEVKNKEGTQQDYGMRIYDTRLGRFLSTDPIAADYPELTPYQFASNSPIENVDLDGLEAYSVKGTYIVNDNIRRSLTAGVVDLNMRKAAASMQPAQAKASQVQAQQQAAQRIANEPQFRRSPSRQQYEEARNEAKIKQARIENFRDPETGQKTAAGSLFESKGWERLNDNLVEPLALSVAGEGLGKLFSSGSFLFKSAGVLENINLTVNGVTANRVLMGSSNKIAVIGRNMSRVESFANGVGGKIWEGFDATLLEAENVANNTKWVQGLKKEGYTIFDVGLDPKYAAKGNLDKGAYYGMETKKIFGDK